MAKANPFKFSTKYQDDETELFYYGYRYYSSSRGRWLTRDPIGEIDQPNLCGFVYNDPANYFDDTGESGRGAPPPSRPPPPGGPHQGGPNPGGPTPLPLPLPPPLPLPTGPTPTLPPGATKYYAKVGNLLVKYCCSKGELVAIALQLSGDAPVFFSRHVNLPGGGDVSSLPPNTWIGVCCDAKTVQIGFTEKIAYFPPGKGGLIYINVSYMVYDNGGNVIASDATTGGPLSIFVSQAELGQILTDKAKVSSEVIDGIRQALKVMGGFLCK